MVVCMAFLAVKLDRQAAQSLRAFPFAQDSRITRRRVQRFKECCAPGWSSLLTRSRAQNREFEELGVFGQVQTHEIVNAAKADND